VAPISKERTALMARILSEKMPRCGLQHMLRKGFPRDYLHKGKQKYNFFRKHNQVAAA
jgi:hypothetical protein